jgi:membrane protein
VDIRATNSGPREFHFAVPKVQVFRGFWEFIRAVWVDVMNDDCPDLAAQMSFYFILSLFPFFIVIAAVVGWLPSTTAWHNLAQWITDYFPKESRQMVFATILGLTRGSNGFLSFGIIAMIWTASSGFVSLMESLSAAYGTRDTRSFLHKRIVAIVATLVSAVFLVASFGLLTFGHWLVVSFRLNRSLSLPLPWEFARWLASLLLMFLALDLINYFLPNVIRPWRWLTCGTAFVALTDLGTSACFNFYLRHFGSFPKFYGTLAGFIIVMTWIYIGSLILLIGAEIDSALEGLKRQGGVA